ncbi:hypothetical protein DM793_18635 [Paenarthrobacter nitroguajacolicus]|uniref:hypothetical protein n=1 Tax=Paenarthrobacter nitroguajacolicus TaxID=211146 RepID=UPI0015BAE31F|nr:hypothetical protein [Paenarthrobacter nitroguajacolicus]NWL13285.1 hypothetical protein [Paenarthrobacter nitroguajacolicus]
MSPKITAKHEVTKKSIFRADPFRGELLMEPGMRPQVMVDRVSHAPGLRVLLKDVMDPSELVALIAVLQAIQDELMPKDDVTEGASE